MSLAMLMHLDILLSVKEEEAAKAIIKEQAKPLDLLCYSHGYLPPVIEKKAHKEYVDCFEKRFFFL